MARDSGELWGALFVVGAVYLVMRALSGGDAAKTSTRTTAPRLSLPQTPVSREPGRRSVVASSPVRGSGFEPAGEVQRGSVCLVCGRHKTECGGHF
jgi:hypothetical protein